MKNKEEIELEDKILGEILIELLGLKKDKAASKMHGKPIYPTSGGTKSVIGLGATIRRLVEDLNQK